MAVPDKSTPEVQPHLQGPAPCGFVPIVSVFPQHEQPALVRLPGEEPAASSARVVRRWRWWWGITTAHLDQNAGLRIALNCMAHALSFFLFFAIFFWRIRSVAIVLFWLPYVVFGFFGTTYRLVCEIRDCLAVLPLEDVIQRLRDAPPGQVKFIAAFACRQGGTASQPDENGARRAAPGCDTAATAGPDARVRISAGKEIGGRFLQEECFPITHWSDATDATPRLPACMFFVRMRADVVVGALSDCESVTGAFKQFQSRHLRHAPMNYTISLGHHFKCLRSWDGLVRERPWWVARAWAAVFLALGLLTSYRILLELHTGHVRVTCTKLVGSLEPRSVDSSADVNVQPKGHQHESSWSESL
jgi:hypothetical protein